MLIVGTGAFLVRLAFALVMGIGADYDYAGTSDQAEYSRFAWSLATGQGYQGMEPGGGPDIRPSAYIPPGTPALYALVYVLTSSRSVIAVRLVQCVIGALSVVLVFLLANALFGRRTAWIAGILFALYPPAAYYCYELMSETLFVFFLIAFLLLCVAYLAPSPSWKSALATGLVLGLAMLTRPAMLFLFPFYLLWLVLVFRSMRQIGLGLLMVLFAALVITPWSIRNYPIYHRYVMVTPAMWTVMVQGNNPEVVENPKYWGTCCEYMVPQYKEYFRGQNLIEREATAKRLTIDWLLANKDKWPFLAAQKFLYFWSPFLRQENRTNRLIMLVSWGPVLVLFVPAYLVSLARMLRQRNPGVLIHFWILAVLGCCLLYFATPRYRFPIEPFCIIFAAATLSWLLGRFRVLTPWKEMATT